MWCINIELLPIEIIYTKLLYIIELLSIELYYPKLLNTIELPSATPVV